MNNTYSTAAEYFKNGYNCAQSLFAAYSEYTGIDEQQSHAVAAAFGGGMGNTQSTCGLVSGALMVLGSTFYNPDNLQVSKEIVMQYSQTLMDLLNRKYGTISCRKLTGIDFSQNMPLDSAAKQKMHETCFRVMEDVCIILDEMLKSKNAGQKQ